MLRTELFWVITQRIEVIAYGRFETTYLEILLGPPLKMGPHVFPKRR